MNKIILSKDIKQKLYKALQKNVNDCNKLFENKPHAKLFFSYHETGPGFCWITLDKTDKNINNMIHWAKNKQKINIKEFKGISLNHINFNILKNYYRCDFSYDYVIPLKNNLETTYDL